MKRIDALKRDNLIIDYIAKHRGRENILSGKQICEFLKKEGYNAKSETIHTLLNRITMERHLPICSLSCKGCFWARTQQELLDSIENLQLKINGLTKHIEHLKSFIIEQ